jgi:membrane protein DedA with SNARE-associated domain
MEHLTIGNIISFVEIHRYTGYLILFIAMVFEGETVLILAGMLASLKAFDVGDVFWIAFFGIVIGNMFWYSVGLKLGHRNFAKNLVLRAKGIIKYFLPRFHERPFKSIFFSKFIYGTNRATVLMSGVFKIDFPLFMKAEVLASILWVFLYEAIGYFFGSAAIWVTHRANRFALIALLFVLLFILSQRLLLHRYEKRQLEENQNNRNSQR